MTQTKAELLQTRHQGDLKLGDADSSHYVGFKAPATVGTSLVWTLPAADGSSNQFLKTDGSGTLSWATDSATDSSKMPLAGGTFSGNVTYNDTIKAIFGNGSDLQIYHNSGSDKSIIYHSHASGVLSIAADHLNLADYGNEHPFITCDRDGAVEIFYDNSKKIETTSGGISVTGGVNLTTNLSLLDNGIAKFGTGDDLQIHHDGSNSYIKDTGTGRLLILGSGVRINNAAGDENMIHAEADGAVELYYDNAKKLETVTGGVTVTGTVSAGAGSFTDDGSTTAGPVINISGDDSSVWFGRIGNETYHNNTGTGFKFYVANDGVLQMSHHGNAEYKSWAMASNNGTTNKYNIFCNASQQVYLYNSTTYVLSTTTHGVNHHKGVTQTASAMSALDIDLRESTYFTKTISGNSTFTFSNPPASGTTGSFTLELTHSSGTVTWPSSVKWNGDTAPTLTAGKTHLFMFVTDDNGTRYRGAALVDYVN